MIGIPEVFEAMTASSASMLLVLGERLLLQLELLRDRLEHELGALQRRREVGLEAHRAALARSPPSRSSTPRASSSQLFARSSASSLTSYSATSIPARSSTAPIPGPIVPVPITAPGSTLVISPSSSCSMLSECARHTRSGVNGSSFIGTPASASAVAIAAGVAACAPSPQPFAP